MLKSWSRGTQKSMKSVGTEFSRTSGILDRLDHNAHRIEMRGDSMRKNRGKAGG
jgi:DNA replication protein DnaC